MNLTYEQALNRAATLCSTSERCTSDIYSKALGWGLSEADAERLVAALISEKFIDESRYARAFVNDKYRFQHWGRTKIRYALRAKRIADSLIDAALAEVVDDEDYLDECLTLLRHRLRGMSLPLSTNDRARLYRFAAQRGFEPSVISKAMSRCTDSADDD